MIWDDDKIIAFDFETSGTLPEYALQPWRVATGDAWPTSLVWMDTVDGKPRPHGGLSPARDMMAEMLEHAIRTDSRIIGWNTSFDISWLLAYGLEDLVMRVKWLDGMLLWRHVAVEPEYDIASYRKKSYGLKACVTEHLPALAGYEQEIDFHDTSPEARKALHKYNRVDVLATLVLGKRWHQKLEQSPRQLKAMELEAMSLPLVAKANLEGMPVDRLAARKLEQILTDTAFHQLAKLVIHGVTEKIVRSPAQLSKMMFGAVDEGYWGLTPLKYGKSGPSTDKETLHEISLDDARAADLKAYREALNNRTKFASALIKSADYNDGYTHPSAHVFGTYTGRMTYSSAQGRGVNRVQTGFALHQTKRGKDYRSVIIAPPGHTLMEFDASGQEFRWMAIASGDQTMLGLCADGEDPHAYMGSRIVQKDYRQLSRDAHHDLPEAKAGRQLGKVANLSLQYRTSANKLRSVARVQYNIPMTQVEADRIRRTYVQTYKGVPTYWAQQISQTKRDGYVETFAGRRVQVAGNWGGKFGWSMGSTAINYRIQGTGGDQKYLALAVLYPYITKYDIKFTWDMHDGLYFFVPDHRVEKFAVDGKYLLDNLPYRSAWGFTPPIPLPWDCKLGPSWGQLKEFDYA